jgi:GNAT superfamily N-acetyltransferase
VRRWIGHPSALILVAVDKKNGNILGVGGLLESGEITLNYVSPDYRNQGVSATLLKSMEDYLSGLGVMAVRLNSTLTARSFYKSRGYVENGRAETGDGLTSFPMLKKLQAC